MNDLQAKRFEIIFYNDSDVELFCNVLQHNYSIHYAYLKHDLDVLPDTGELKKMHIHFMFELLDKDKIKASTLINLAKSVNVELNLNQFAYIKQWKYAIRYLIHFDDKNKFQYCILDINSNFDFMPFFKSALDETNSIKIIINHIKEMTFDLERKITISDLLDWVLENGLFSYYRRCYNLIKDYCESCYLSYLSSLTRGNYIYK